MIIEFQMSARAFLDAQLLALQTQKLDFSALIPFGGQSYAIDHIEYGANSLSQGETVTVPVYYDNTDPRDYQNVTQRLLELIQPATVYIVSMDDVLAHPNGVPSLFITLSAEIHYFVQYQLVPLTGDALAAAVTNDTATSLDIFSIQYNFAKLLSINPLPAGQTTADIGVWINTYMAAQQKPLSAPLGLVANAFSSDGKILKNQPLPINTGMSIDPDLSRLSFRQEPGGGLPSDPVTWQQFFNGVFPDRMGGASWAVYMEKAVVESITQNKIYDGLEKSKDKRFTLVSGVGSTYANNSGTPTVTSQFGGNVDTPICTIFTDVQIVSTMRVDTPNSLTSDGQISWNPHGGGCELTAGILGAAIGFGVDLIMPWLTDLINPITGALAGIGTVAILDGTYQPTLPSIHDCVADGATHMVCTAHFPAISTLLGSLNFTSILAFDDGVSLQGQLVAIPVGAASVALTLSDEIHWDAPSVPCSYLDPSTFQAIAADPQAYGEVSATIDITANGLAPVYIFYVTPTDDDKKLGLLTGHFTQAGDQAPATVTIQIPYPGPDYFAAPYPIELLIATSGGIRLVSLGAIPAFTQAVIDSMFVGLGAQLDKCKEKVVDQFQYFRKYVLRWAIDPDQGQKVFHSYGIAMRGLAEGERVTIAQTNGRLLQTAFAREGEPMFLDALMDPLGYDGLELIPQRADALDQIRDAFSSSGTRSLDVTGQLIVTRSQIQVPRTTTGISAGFVDNRATLLVRTRSETFGYDLTNPRIPRLASRQPSSSDALSNNQVRSRGHVFSVSENTITQYDVAKSRERALVASHDMPGVRQILAPPVSQGRMLLVQFDDGKNRLYQFTDGREPAVAVEYHTAPWWLFTVPFNGLLLRWDNKTATVSINEYGVKKSL